MNYFAFTSSFWSQQKLRYSSPPDSVVNRRPRVLRKDAGAKPIRLIQMIFKFHRDATSQDIGHHQPKIGLFFARLSRRRSRFLRLRSTTTPIWKQKWSADAERTMFMDCSPTFWCDLRYKNANVPTINSSLYRKSAPNSHIALLDTNNVHRPASHLFRPESSRCFRLRFRQYKTEKQYRQISK